MLHFKSKLDGLVALFDSFSELCQALEMYIRAHAFIACMVCRRHSRAVKCELVLEIYFTHSVLYGQMFGLHDAEFLCIRPINSDET